MSPAQSGADERGMGIGRVGAAMAAGVEAARDAVRAATDCPECGVGDGAHNVYCSIAARRRGWRAQGRCPHDGADCHHNCSQNERGENVMNWLCWREEQGMALSPPKDQPAGGAVGDPVNHPSHYTWLPNGLEVIDVTKHFDFVLGNVLKYIMRAGRKGGADSELEDLLKARWYLNYRIEELEREAGG